VKMTTLIVASAAFAFFILCPRMVGMASVIAGIKETNPWLVVLLGAIIAIPLMMLMYWVLQKFGAGYAIGLAVITDIIAALVIGTYSWKSSVSIIIIAAFVWAGIAVSNLVAKAMS
jgi:O-antigen/teichoic acid export membrane protein